MTCGYGMYAYGSCGCEVVYTPGILDFFLDKITGSNPNRYFTRFAGSVSYTDDPNEALIDGSGYTKWGMAYRDNLQVFCDSPDGRVLASWNGTRVLRREFWTLDDFADEFSGGSGSLASHTPTTDPHSEGWTEAEGSWTSSSGTVTLTSTGNGRATTDYRFADATTTGYLYNSSTDVEAGILARGDGTLTGSIRLHWSKAANEAELFIFNTSAETISFGAEAPTYVMLQIVTDGEDVTAYARGFDSGGTATGALKNTATYTDGTYDFDTSPTIYGVYGEKDTGQDCIFDRFGAGAVFSIEFAFHTRTTLYKIGKTSSDIEVLSTHPVLATLCTPNVLLEGTAANFTADATRTYRFLEEDGTLLERNVTGSDHSGGYTDRELGTTAGLFDPAGRDFGYGLGIKISGNYWRLVGGAIDFPAGDEMPIVTEADEIDTYDWGGTPPNIFSPFGGVSGEASVSYQSMPDGSVVSGSWGNSSFSGFGRRFLRIGGTTHIISGSLISAPVIAPDCAALIAVSGSDGVFKIYNSSGVIYSDTHATRWDNARIICASDRWFYLINVADWSGYTTEEPSSVFGGPPTYIHMLISLDGSKRVRVAQYDEGDSRYEEPTTTPISGSFPSLAMRSQVDCVKLSTLDYALPDTIDYPAP